LRCLAEAHPQVLIIAHIRNGLLRRRVAMAVSARMEGGWPMTLSAKVLRPAL
jgi:hypothetical protein